MKRRHVIIINLIFVALMLFSAGTVYQYMTGTKPLTLISNVVHPKKTVLVKTAKCSPQKANTKLDSSDAGLSKLAVYQQACHSYVTGTEMVFTSMAPDLSTAHAYADADAKTLKAYARSDVRPLVIAEPSDTSGNTLDYATFASGAYNTETDAYFAELKAQGISDAQLGIWNPFPEANLPYWNNNQPQFFAPAVNNYVGILRKYFPTAQVSVMLNSATYAVTDFNWQDGDYDSLMPYIKGITPGTINYAGLQGFPWLAAQGGSGAIINAAEYLNPSLLSEMADYFHIKKVWFNTGTFATKYALDPTQLVAMDPGRRKAVLATVDSQALILQKQGYQVAINMFAQNKSQESEETDWSYWSGDKPFNSEATPVITDFINTLNQQKIDFWLFDR